MLYDAIVAVNPKVNPLIFKVKLSVEARIGGIASEQLRQEDCKIRVSLANLVI